MGSWWCRFACESFRCLSFSTLKFFFLFFSISLSLALTLAPSLSLSLAFSGPFPCKAVNKILWRTTQAGCVSALGSSGWKAKASDPACFSCACLTQEGILCALCFLCRAPLVLFSGGMPRASYGDRHCLTILQDRTHVTLDFTSRVIDFFTIHCTDGDMGVCFSS